MAFICDILMKIYWSYRAYLDLKFIENVEKTAKIRINKGEIFPLFEKYLQKYTFLDIFMGRYFFVF